MDHAARASRKESDVWKLKECVCKAKPGPRIET